MKPEERLRALAVAAGTRYWPTSEQFGAEWNKKTSDFAAACSPDVVLRIAAVVEVARRVEISGFQELREAIRALDAVEDK